eukprot:5886457-Pyramimonas_sp.AAC.1
MTVHFENADFYAEHWHINFVPRAAQLSGCSFSISSLPGTDSMLRPKCQFDVFLKILQEAPCFDPEDCYACKELYEVPGGDQ